MKYIKHEENLHSTYCEVEKKWTFMEAGWKPTDGCVEHVEDSVPVELNIEPEVSNEDVIDEIDTNGNGRITKKEIKAFISKDKDK